MTAASARGMATGAANTARIPIHTAENPREPLRPLPVQVVGVAVILKAGREGAGVPPEGKVPVFAAVFGRKRLHVVHKILVTLGIGQVGAGQWRGEHDQPDPLLRTVIGNALQIVCPEFADRRLWVHIRD